MSNACCSACASATSTIALSLLEHGREVETHPVPIGAVISIPDGGKVKFDIDPFRKHCLLNGLDEIGLTTRMDGEISAYEARIAAARPWIGGAAAA